MPSEVSSWREEIHFCHFKDFVKGYSGNTDGQVGQEARVSPP